MVAVGAILAQVVAAAAPAPKPTPLGGLREIGRVHATTVFCKKTVLQANGAISILLQNDALVGSAVDFMHHSNMDGTVIDRNRSKMELERQFVALRQSATQGMAAAKELRKEAESAPSAAQKAELTSFADALGGALSRQRKIADKIGGFLAYLDAHEPRSDGERGLSGLDPSPEPRYAPSDPLREKPKTLGEATAAYADLLQGAIAPIRSDEAAAEDRIDGAFLGC